MRRPILALVLLLAACASEPRPVAVAPPLEPPPAAARALSRDEALAFGRETPSDAAIAKLDRYPFAFTLDAEALAWFAAQDLPTPVLDYLDKRSKVRWEELRGDLDPDQAPPR